MDTLVIFLDILLKPPQPLMGLFLKLLLLIYNMSENDFATACAGKCEVLNCAFFVEAGF